MAALGPTEVLPESMRMGFNKSRSREDCLRDVLNGLGHPTINIELTRPQLDNALNDALRLFMRHHRDGSFDNYYAVCLDSNQAAKGYCRVPEKVDAVYEVISVGSAGVNGSGEGAFGGTLLPDAAVAPTTPTSIGGMQFTSIAWQMQASAYAGTNMSIGGTGGSGGGTVNGVTTIAPGGRYSSMSYADYLMAKNNMQGMLSSMKTPSNFTFVRYQRKINLHFPVKSGDVVCFRVNELLDPDSDDFAGEMFDDYHLKAIVTANVKIAWGMVLRKFGGITLPGGVTLDGDTLVQEGSTELEKLVEELQNQQPIGFFMG